MQDSPKCFCIHNYVLAWFDHYANSMQSSRLRVEFSKANSRSEIAGPFLLRQSTWDLKTPYHWWYWFWFSMKNTFKMSSLYSFSHVAFDVSVCFCRSSWNTRSRKKFFSENQENVWNYSNTSNMVGIRRKIRYVVTKITFLDSLQKTQSSPHRVDKSSLRRAEPWRRGEMRDVRERIRQMRNRDQGALQRVRHRE